MDDKQQILTLEFKEIIPQSFISIVIFTNYNPYHFYTHQSLSCIISLAYSIIE